MPPPLEIFPPVDPQPDLSSTGGPQLAPVSPIPDLSGLSDDEAADVIAEWFLSNFEDPVQETPRIDGEFLYIWGGPYDARDEIYNAFNDYAPETVIEAAIEAVEAEGVSDWAPHGSRSMADSDDLPLPPSSAAGGDPRALHAEMLKRIEVLERDMAKLSRRRRGRGIGDNNPPEPIESEPLTADDLHELEDACAVLKAQPPINDGPPPVEAAAAVNFLTTLAKRLGSGAEASLKHVGGQVRTFTDETVRAAGKEFGKRMMQAPFWWAVIQGIHALADAAQRWLESLGSPF